MSAPAPLHTNIILVDGTCVFCNRLVALLLRHDPTGIFHFAHLQSEYARAVLAKHGADPTDRDGVYLLMDAGTPTERLLVDGAAGREIWPRLFRIAVVIRWIPLMLLNAGYRLFARYRYRLFGRYESCLVPSDAERRRFLT